MPRISKKRGLTGDYADVWHQAPAIGQAGAGAGGGGTSVKKRATTFSA